MKTKPFYIVIATLVVLAYIIPACNKDSLTDLNKPLNSVNYPIPAYLFTQALLNTPKDNYSVLAEGMQYYSTYKEVPAVGDKYYSFNGTEADFGTVATGTYTVKLNLLYQLDQAV